jgi:signal transduction histidine kinase
MTIEPSGETERGNTPANMRTRIWPSVGIGFGILLMLVPLFAWLVSRKAAEIDFRTRDSHQRYQRADEAITDIQANIYKGTLPGKDVETQLTVLRLKTMKSLRELSELLDPSQHGKLLKLNEGLDRYWESVSYASERSNSGNDTLAHVLLLAEEVDSLNQANLRLEEHQIETQQHVLRQFAAAATGLLLLLGLAIATCTTAYLAKLERVSEAEKVCAEKAEYELRRLSNRLVRAQEEERKNISRELHDEVGQVLTGLRMELGSLSGGGDDVFKLRLKSVKLLAEDALRSVRNLALLLRPSMLDDLGLEPALRWQSKEFSRRSEIPVSVDIQGSMSTLPEAVSICLYRAIQEALTNCMKYAKPSRVTIAVRQKKDLVTASVQDDGVGFDMRDLRTQGLDSYCFIVEQKQYSISRSSGSRQ